MEPKVPLTFAKRRTIKEKIEIAEYPQGNPLTKQQRNKKYLNIKYI